MLTARQMVSVIGFLFLVSVANADSAGYPATSPEAQHLAKQRAALAASGVRAQCQSYGSILKMWFGGGISDTYEKNHQSIARRSVGSQVRQEQNSNPFVGVQDSQVAGFLRVEFRRIHENHLQGYALDLDAFYARCLQFFSEQGRADVKRVRSVQGSRSERAKPRSSSLPAVSADPYASRR